MITTPTTPADHGIPRGVVGVVAPYRATTYHPGSRRHTVSTPEGPHPRTLGPFEWWQTTDPDAHLAEPVEWWTS